MASARRGANPFDSDQEDEALDPLNRADDDEEVVDFSLKPAKSKKSKLQGQAKTVKAFDDETGAEVIGRVWSTLEPSDVKPSSAVEPSDAKPSSAVTKRWNIFDKTQGGDSGKPVQKPTASASPKTSREVEQLHQALRHAEEDRWKTLPEEEAARRLVVGLPVWLEGYRTYDSKIALLEHVDKLHDGDALMRVILFLKQTLRENAFLAALLGLESAERHYVSYLRQLGDGKALESFYSMFQRARQGGMLMYQHQSKASDPLIKLAGLRKCEKAFKTDTLLAHELSYIQEEIELLDLQQKLERQDSRFECEKQADFVRFPRKQLVGQSLMTTVFYCCLYHSRAPETKPFAPEALRKNYKLTERQFLWMAIGALAKRRDYPAIEELLTVKGWFGSKKQRSAIGFDKVAELLHQHRAAPDRVCEYLRKVDDLQLRLATAKKLDCLDVVIEVYKAQKDWNALTQIRDKLRYDDPRRLALNPLLETMSARRK